MALDPREFQKRRFHKQRQRQQQIAKRKRLLIRLGIAGAVVLACTVLLLTFGRKKPAAPAVSTPTALSTTAATGETTVPEQTGNTEDTATEPTEPPTTVLHIACAGDLNLSSSVVDAYDGEYDYTRLLLDVAPVLAQADIATLNLEGNFFGAPYGEDFSAPPSLADALDAAGVDFVQLANSYSIYKGIDGLKQTIQTVRDAGMEPVGVWPNADAAKESYGYTLCTVQGVKIAFVAFTKGMNGMALPPGSESCVNLLYKDYSSDYQQVNTEGITSVLDAISKEEPDLTVAMLHWGSEGYDILSESQQEICKLFRENGVDAIIGTHSHLVQQIEYHPTSGSFVAYSLGDFSGTPARPVAGSEYSVILDLEVTRDNATGATRITGFDYIPIYTVREEGKPTRILRIDPAIAAYENGHIDSVSAETYEAMKAARERIAKRIKGE